MSESRFQRLQRLFDEALALPPAQRPAFLREACGDDAALREEILSLLTHADEDDDSHLTLSARVLPMAEAVIGGAGMRHEAGQQIGHYRLIREIGSGGMGSVYLAERDDAQFRHQVALKLVRGFPTAPVLERFKRERELLATLRHPNIARLFDGGTTEAGQPYLVMEYVEGVPLDAWCKREQPSLPARLRLFQSLCSAVQHAHQNLIVHRDLKPANVLVRADGEPVLLDFGIGKLLGDGDGDGGESEREATRLQALTPAYASPEQLRGAPVTTLSDIYGLGLILYELLAGEPLRKEGHGATTRIAPSRVAAAAKDSWVNAAAPALRGDLDNVVRKALREEPQRRYPTAAAFGADIERYFDGRPLDAAPDAWTYRVRKFVARHPLALGATVATIAVLAVLSLRLAQERDRALLAQERARLEAEGANQQAVFLVDLFKRASPEATRGEDVSVRDLVDGARDDLAGRDFGRPEVKARLETALGEIYISLGQPEPSIGLLEQAVARLRGDAGADGRVLARALTQLGRAYSESARHRSAHAVLDEALMLGRSVYEPGRPEIAHVLMSLGVAEESLGEHEAARRHFEESERIFAAAGESHRGNRASALHNLGWAANRRDDRALARELLAESLAIKTEVYGQAHPSTFVTSNVLAMVEAEDGDYAAAAARLEQLLKAQIRVLGEPSVKVAASHNELGSTLQDAGDYAAAERHYRAAIEQHGQLSPEGSFEQAIPINNLGTLYEETERYAEAEALYRRSLAIRERHAEDRRGIARARHNLSRVLMALGRLDEARDECEAAHAEREALLPAGHNERLDSLIVLARIAQRAGDPDKARGWLDRVRSEAGDRTDLPAPAIARWREAEAELAAASNDRAAAIAARRAQLAALAQRLPDDHAQIARARLQLAELLATAGERAEAQRLLDQAAAALASRIVPGSATEQQLVRLRMAFP